MSNISVVAAFKLTIGLWTDNYLFMNDYDGRDKNPDRIELVRDGDGTVVVVVGLNGEELYRKRTEVTFEKMFLYSTALHDLPVYSRLDEIEAENKASIAATNECITLRIVAR